MNNYNLFPTIRGDIPFLVISLAHLVDEVYQLLKVGTVG